MKKEGLYRKGLLLLLTFCLTFTSVPVMAAEELSVNVTATTAASAVKQGWGKRKSRLLLLL